MSYARERLPIRLVLPAAIFLTTASLAASARITVPEVLVDLVLASLLVIQFRLWDDLCDLDRDRIDHPQRVLCRLSSHRVFDALRIGLFAINLVAIGIFKSQVAVIVFITVNLLFVLWYRSLRRWFIDRLGGWHVVLLKYPAFVLLLGDDLATSSVLPLGLSMVVVYLCFCLYEILDDDRIHRIPGATACLAAEMLCLMCAAALIVEQQRRTNGTVDSAQLAVSLIGSAVLVFLFFRHRNRTNANRRSQKPPSRDSALMNHAVFLVGFGLLLSYSVGRTQNL